MNGYKNIMNIQHIDINTIYKIAELTANPHLKRLANSITNYPDINWTDAMSWGQIRSKAKLLDMMHEIGYYFDHKTIHIHAGWVGLFNWLISNYEYYDYDLISLDIDIHTKKAAEFLNKSKNYNFRAKTHDIMDTTPYEIGFFDDGDECIFPDLIVNTSCEHIDIDTYLEKYFLLAETSGKSITFALQSNNLFSIKDHISCVNSLSEFEDKCVKFGGEVLHSDTLQLEKYDRYTVIVNI